MKVFKVFLLVSMVFVFSATSMADAEYKLTVCAASPSLANMSIYVNHMGDGVYSVNGVLHTTKKIAFSGSAIIEGSNARFGITLNNQLSGYSPVVWEFVLSLGTLTGTGNWQWLTGAEPTGALSFTPGACGSSAAFVGASPDGIGR